MKARQVQVAPTPENKKKLIRKPTARLVGSIRYSEMLESIDEISRIRMARETPDFNAELLSKLSRYRWYVDRGCWSGNVVRRLKAFWVDIATLDLDEEEVGLTLAMLQSHCAQSSYSLQDFHTFCHTSTEWEHTSISDGVISWTEHAWLEKAPFLHPDELCAFQSFVKKMLNIFRPLLAAERARGEQPGVKNSGKKKFVRLPGEEHLPPRKVSKIFTSEEEAIAFFQRYRDGYLLHLPRKSTFKADTFSNPFDDIKNCPAKERIWAYPALAEWGIMAYWFAARMCMTNEQILHGLVTDEVAGRKMAEFLLEKGCDVAQLNYSDDVQCRKVFGFELEFKGRTTDGSVVVYLLPSFKTLWAGEADGVKNVNMVGGKSAVQKFIELWKVAMGDIAQDVMRARYYVLVAPLRREVMYIRGVRDLKATIGHQLTGAGVALGIAVFNEGVSRVAAYLAEE
jgi:hypothetical protein